MIYLPTFKLNVQSFTAPQGIASQILNVKTINTQSHLCPAFIVEAQFCGPQNPLFRCGVQPACCLTQFSSARGVQGERCERGRARRNFSRKCAAPTKSHEIRIRACNIDYYQLGHGIPSQPNLPQVRVPQNQQD